VNGNVFKDYPLSFYDCVKVWGNSLTKVIPKLLPNGGWPDIDQRLNEFQPIKSSTDYIIQTCDIISNFFFNFIRHTVGSDESSHRLKSEVIQSLIPLVGYSEKIKSSFIIKDKEVFCRNPELKSLIEITRN
jgi:hypothetical protein